MAHKVAIQDGNYSAAATWNSVTNVPTLHATTNIAVSGTSYTLGFTAPNLVNACVGVLMHVTTKPTGGTSYTVTLQESTIDTAAAVTILNSAFPVANHWVFFKFAVPYVFTTLVAGSYRFKIVRNAATTANLSLAANSGGANPAFLAVDDRTGVPTTEDIWIVQANCTGSVSVTMDGTQLCGSGTDTAVVVRRSIGNAINLYAGGLLSWDTVADATLTSKGNVAIFGDATTGSAELRAGTVASPMPAARVAKLRFNENGVTTNFGGINWPNGKVTLQGTPKSSTSLWKTKYASGVGTVADPLIVADAVNWIVGDEIIVGASSDNATNYNESENKFIITVNSPTSYVIADAKGGPEAALTYVHNTNAWALNVERNVIVDSTTITEAFYFGSQSNVPGDFDVDWTRFETVGGSTFEKRAIYISYNVAFYANCDYSVVYRSGYTGFQYASRQGHSFTGLIVCNQNTTTSIGAFVVVGNNGIFTDCFSIKNARYGWQFGGTGNSFIRCYAISCSTDSASNGGMSLGSYANQFIDCEAHCNRGRGLYFNGSNALVDFNGCLVGTKGTNTSDIVFIDDSFQDLTLRNCSFGSATFILNYLMLVSGSRIRFDNLNVVDNNHTWYTSYGIARSTGAGLADTTVRTAGSLAVRLAPEEATTGFTWSFKILARAVSAVSITGFIKKNAAFGTDTVTVNLYLPGSITPDATQTMPDDTNWNVFNLAGNYTGVVDRYATVEIVAKSVAAGAYCYIDDLYNGTNKITALDTWDDGMPSPIMFEQLGDAAAVMELLTATLTTPGTIGKWLVDMGYKVDDNQALILAT